MSELRQIVTFERFKNAYEHFMKQADKNVETQKAQGPRTPYGMPFKSGKNAFLQSQRSMISGPWEYMSLYWHYA